VLKRLATLRLEAGQKDEAREVLDQLVWIRPGDEALHSQLGDLWLEASQPSRALREFGALLASAPQDVVAAHYKMASAYHQLSDREHTREHLLLALEQAPGYRPAQKLLLEIHRR
jgi:predicted Zn-dependent protease